LATAFIIGQPEPDVAEVDTAALERCIAGDPSALRSFVDCYKGRVFAFLSRTLGAGPHVEDLAQEVFIRACRALPSFDGAGSARLSTWLLTIARRIAIDARRKRRIVIGPLDSAPQDRTASYATPETERRRMEIAHALERAAADLPDDQRDVFVLAEFHDLEMSEIASILGIPENTAKTRLFRARQRLRILLRGVWEDS
jgi:RNA polymerase sigma-70 factor (ECF subfamily)